MRPAALAPAQPRHSAPGWRYGLLGLPLAFAALPLYVALPAHYAREFQVPLATLGTLLLATRAGDAVIDPWLGRQVDRWLQGPVVVVAGLCVLAALLLAGCFQGLFFPPTLTGHALLVWCATMLMGCSLGYATLTLLHQAWGARLGHDDAERTRLVAWREGAALFGVILASLLPGWAGLQTTSLTLAAALLLGLWALAGAPRPPRLTPLLTPNLTPIEKTSSQTDPANQAGRGHRRWSPPPQPALRRLLVIHGLNGLASALPATLVLFFIADRLQSPGGAPLFLGIYFASAALSLPVWVRLVRRWGLSACWLGGMALAVAGFLAAASLSAGQLLAYSLICVATGLAQGADLSLPPALLAAQLQRTSATHSPIESEGEGEWFGWWQLVTKLNLALAAGISLPLLQALGYQPGSTDAASTTALAWVYGGLPCVFKLLAAWLLWRFHRAHTRNSSP